MKHLKNFFKRVLILSLLSLAFVSLTLKTGSNLIISEYRAEKPIIPVVSESPIIYSTLLGGYYEDFGHSLIVDSEDCVYILGATNSVEFPITPDAYDSSYNTNVDVFLAKMDKNGGNLIHSTYFGGNGADQGHYIAMDSIGNVYIAGETSSSDFPTTPGVLMTTLGGEWDGFVAKFNHNLTELLYCTLLGGNAGESVKGIIVDKMGYAYVWGYTYSTDFPITTGAFDTTINGQQDGFLTKLNQNGTEIIASTFIGGSDLDIIKKCVVDPLGSLYLAGETLSIDFPTTPMAFNTLYNNGGDAFILKINEDLSSLEYATFLGGGQVDQIFDIFLDKQNCVLVVGLTRSTDFPTTSNAYGKIHFGESDGFITKLSSNGTSLLYSSMIGGSGVDNIYCITLDTMGNVIAGGDTDSTDFPVTEGAYSNSHNGDIDGFIVKIDTESPTLIYSTLIGGQNWDSVSDMEIDLNDNIFITGFTNSYNFPTTAGVYGPTLQGYYDAFITKMILLPIFPIKEKEEEKLNSPFVDGFPLVTVLSCIWFVLFIKIQRHSRKIDPPIEYDKIG
jgi:hypothetical protein